MQAGLIPLFWAFTLPLLIGDAIDVVTKRSDVRPVRLAVLLVVAYLCSVYFVVFGGLTYGIIVGVAALRRHSWRIPAMAGAATLVALLVLTPVVVSRVRYEHSEKHRGADTQLLSDSNLFSADALSIVAQPTRSTVLLPRPTVLDNSLLRLIDPTHTLEWTIFPGLLLLAGGVVFLFRRDARRVPIVVAMGVMWVLALGPSAKIGGTFLWTHGGKPVSWLPYRVVLAVPALGALRAPFRTGYVIVALLAAATAIALHRIVTRWPQRVVLVAAGSAVLLATNLLLPLPTDTFGASAAGERALRKIPRLAHKGDTVMGVPADCHYSFISEQTMHRPAGGRLRRRVRLESLAIGVGVYALRRVHEVALQSCDVRAHSHPCSRAARVRRVRCRAAPPPIRSAVPRDRSDRARRRGLRRSRRRGLDVVGLPIARR